MKRLLIGAAAFGLVVAMTTVHPLAQGQGRGRGGGGGFTNLQVLPSDIAPQQLIGIMQNFETALGVECDFCHQFNGRGAPDNDMASDAKRPKQIARVMMRMVGQINQTIADGLNEPADEINRVQCITCHRGSEEPEIEAPAAD